MHKAALCLVVPMMLVAPAPSPRVPRSLASPYGVGPRPTRGAQTGGVRPPPPDSRAYHAPLCGGASHEAEGRRDARGGGADRVGPPTGWYRLRLLRQILDELVPGVEQFLLVDLMFLRFYTCKLL